MFRSAFLKIATTAGIAACAAALSPAGASVVPGAAATAIQAAPVSPELVAFGGGRRVVPHGGFQGGRGGFAHGPMVGGGRFAHGPVGGGQRFVHRGGRGVAPFLGGLGAGIVAGALANPYGYGYGPDYDSGDVYGQPAYEGTYGDEPGVEQGPGDVAYCAQRFKSYDPASGTYLGYDGQRHPCP